jgi:AraC-like DNA-binding protein
MPKAEPDTATRPVVGLAERYQAGVVPTHSHRRSQLMYAVRGTLTVLADRGSWVLPPHRALWIPAGLSHGLKLGAVAELRTLYVAPAARGAPTWRTCEVIDVPPLVRELILAAVELGWHYAPRGPAASLIEVLLDRLSTVQQQPLHLPEPRDVRARRYTAHMYANLAERRPLPVLAKELGASPRTLERIFKAETGMSVGAWTRQMRLIFALERLAGGRSVGDTAFEVGYENPSSFIAVFRRAFGTTPTAYFAAAGSTR